MANGPEIYSIAEGLEHLCGYNCRFWERDGRVDVKFKEVSVNVSMNATRIIASMIYDLSAFGSEVGSDV